MTGATGAYTDFVYGFAGRVQRVVEFHRHVGSYEQLADYERLLERLGALRAAGQSRAQIAEELTREGFRPPQRDGVFTAGIVAQLLRRLPWKRAPIKTMAEEGSRVTCSSAERNLQAPACAGEWWAADLARCLDMPLTTLHAWHRQGWVRGRKLRGWPDRWIYCAEGAELDRLRRLRSHQRSNRRAPYPNDLTTPLPPVNN